MKGVGICPRGLEYVNKLNPYIAWLAVCVRTPWQSIICYFRLAARGAFSGVFASYPHPGI